MNIEFSMIQTIGFATILLFFWAMVARARVFI